MDTHISELHRVFNLQKKNYSPSNNPSYNERIDRLNKIELLTRNHIDDISEALQKDFGCRNPDWSFMADIFPQLYHVKHVKKHLKKWMKREKTSSGLYALSGQKTYIVNEPLGVVGIMSPFNAPVSLGLDPAIEALAAGNTVILKISESTPHTAGLMKILAAKYFDESIFTVVVGNVEVSRIFSSLNWDKFFFTGGSEVGKKVLEACAKNLTQAILELGGKTPCVILEDADLELTAKKIGTVRQLNAGQVCISGDYVFLPENKLDRFVELVVKNNNILYPNIIDNPSYTSIINDREFNRIISYIDEAVEKGGKVIQCNPKNENVPDSKNRKIPLTLVINPDENLKVSQQEIFGPILSIYTYKNINEAVDFINRKEKPLALYVFGKNKTQINHVVENTSSGGVTINDMLVHANAPNMGFGGVGYSGMGRYKGGFIGYQAFTNPKAVHEQGLLRKYTAMFFPPYQKEKSRNMLRSMVGVKE